MNQDLMQKLVIAKKIMDKHEEKPRGSSRQVSNTVVENYDAPPAHYNIPQEFLAEQPKPKVNQPQLPTQDRIMNSKLPDEIKRLMMEHPIEQPKIMGTEAVLSDELIEAASRLMTSDPSGKQVGKPIQRQQQVISENLPDSNSLRNMLKEVVKEVLSENGILAESTQKTKEQISFRVGQHVFEGVVTKIKKMK
jgi:hypothetical protein